MTRWSEPKFSQLLINPISSFSFTQVPTLIYYFTVGKPIPIPKVENPSKELIEEYLDKFFEALHALFEENKHKYDLAGSNAVLTIS